PTEAEWEWATRAGADKPVTVTQKEAAKVAWHSDNADEQTRAVGKLAPNAWCLHDTLGNVAELVVTADGTGAVAGGSYLTEWKELGSAHRERYAKAWQARDCQLPKSVDWLTDGMHVGIRLVMEE
ncbi:MAG: formylglycine-generating enzyme family protein, partial [Phycisphaerae bacterium]